MKEISSVLTDCGRKNGIELNMPRADYDAIHRLNPSSIVAGMIDHQEVNPAAIKFAFEDHWKPTTPAAQDRMDRGTLAHLLLLQPERVQEEVAIWKAERRAGAEWDAFKAVNHNKMIVRWEDWMQVNAAVREFRFNPKLNALLTDLDAEVAMFSNEGGIYTKGLVDAVTRGDACKIVDIKTTEAGISWHSTKATIRNFHYREKMAAYKRWYERESGREVIGCYDLFLSMTPPYAMRIVKMSTIALEWGSMRLMTAIESARECLESKQWPMFIGDDVADVDQYEMPIEGEEVQLDFGEN